MWAINGEDDIDAMKVDGAHGDFIVYNKPQDTECPVRISFMIQEDARGSEFPKCKAQKVKLKKTQTQNDGRPGFALDTVGFIKWFDTMPELVDYYKNDTIHPFKRPYFHSSADVRPSAPIQVTPSASPIPNRPKPKHSNSRSDHPFTHSLNNPRTNDMEVQMKSRKPRSKPSTLDRVQELKLPDPSNDSGSESEPEYSPSDPLPPRTLPNLESPIIFDYPDVKKLLEGKCEGTYVIHKDKHKNSETNPYSILVVSPSRSTGTNRIKTAEIYFDAASNEYKIGKRSYASVDCLLESNSETFKFNVKFDRPHYINPHEIIGSEKVKEPKEENLYVEHYKK